MTRLHRAAQTSHCRPDCKRGRKKKKCTPSLHRGARSLPLKSGLFTGNERHGALNHLSLPRLRVRQNLQGPFSLPFTSDFDAPQQEVRLKGTGNTRLYLNAQCGKKEDGWALKAPPPMPRSRHEGAAISVSHISPEELLVILRCFSPLSASPPALLSRVDPRRQRSDGSVPSQAKEYRAKECKPAS